MPFMLKIQWDIKAGREADFRANQAALCKVMLEHPGVICYHAYYPSQRVSQWTEIYATDEAFAARTFVTASRLCQAEYELLFRLQDGAYRLAAAYNAEADFIRQAVEHPIPPGRGSLVGRTALERKTVHVLDCLADPEYTYVDYQRVGKYRTMLGVPLLRLRDSATG